MIKIRYAMEGDLDAIAALESAIFSDAWSKKAIAESLAQDYVTILTAVEEENVCGYLICYRMINEGNIVRVAVDPSIRRKGIGRKLMEEILIKGEEMGLTEYSLEVRVSNEPAISLYTDFGFVSEGIRKNYYTEPVEDGSIMWRH